MTPTYRIREWNARYENNRTRELKHMDWVPVPNRQDGSGYSELMDHVNGAAHFGAWIAILEIASKCRQRGTLEKESGTIPQDAAGTSREGAGSCGMQPMTTQDFARMARMPITVIEDAIPRLLKIGWMEVLENVRSVEIPQDAAGKCDSFRARDARVEGKGMEQNGMERNIRAVPESRMNGHGHEWAELLYGRHPKKKDRVLVEGALYAIMESSSDAESLFAEIARVHALWCPIWEENNGRYAPSLAHWLDDRGWTQMPCAKQKEMTATEIAIQRARQKDMEIERNGTN